jgi:membrane protein YdbS with pleckstrin-like domain
VSVLSGTLSQPKARIKPTSVVYWMRFFLAIIAGFSEVVLHVNVLTFGDSAQIVGVAVGIIFYVLSVMIVKYLLRYDDAALKGKNRQITLGGGTFIFIWIMVTVLLNTLSVG